MTAPASTIFEWTTNWALEEGLKLWKSSETSSTNSVAKDDEAATTKPELGPSTYGELAVASEPTLYITRHQTKGRGRGANTWLAPEGSALLSSWSFAMRSIPQPILSPLVGLALFEAALEVWPAIDFNLKAPNDLFIGDKKVAGLLIETVDVTVERRTVVGLGLNVTDQPENVPTATSLAEHLGRAPEETEWLRFLGIWKTRLSTAIAEGQRDLLTPVRTDCLKVALNRHPLLKEPIQRVDELGQLHFASRIIRWHEL